MKVPQNCTYINKKSKVSSREKINKMDDFKNFISRTNNKDITVKKIIKNPNNNKQKYIETEESKSINKSLSKQVSFSKNFSTSKKKLTQSLCLESKEKKKNKNKNDKLHNSQSNLGSYFLDKFRNFSKEKFEKRELSKLEDNIINQSFRNTIKLDTDIIGKNKLPNAFSSSSLNLNEFSPLFTNEYNTSSHYLNNDDYENKIKEFFNLYSKEYILQIDDDMLQLETQIMLEKIFDLLNSFNIQKRENLKNYSNYNNAFISFSNNYLELNKKYDKLKDKIRKSRLKEMNYKLNKKFINEFNTKIEPKLFIEEINIWKNVTNNCTINDNLYNFNKNKLIDIFLSIVSRHKSKLNTLAKKFVNDLNDKINNLDYTFSNDNSTSLIHSSNSIGSKVSIGTSSSTNFHSTSISISKKNQKIKINKQSLIKPFNKINKRCVIKKI